MVATYCVVVVPRVEKFFLPDYYSKYMLARKYRLKNKKDFRNLYQRGKSYAYPLFVLYRRVNKEEVCRIGFSISKKVGCAVVRNRLKRQFREAVRRQISEFVSGYDYVFIIRKQAVGVIFAEICNQMHKAIGRDKG